MDDAPSDGFASTTTILARLAFEPDAGAGVVHTIRFMLENGLQTFCVSWRNPTAENRNWGLDTYVSALDEAVDVVRDTSSSDDVQMMGSCSGGITSAAYLATLGAAKIKNLVLCVCLLDTAAASDSAFGSLVTPETMMAAKQASRLLGVLDGHDLARMFAWMRPNDLIWNYWVNNYLLGKPPRDRLVSKRG